MLPHPTGRYRFHAMRNSSRLSGNALSRILEAVLDTRATRCKTPHLGSDPPGLAGATGSPLPTPPTIAPIQNNYRLSRSAPNPRHNT